MKKLIKLIFILLVLFLLGYFIYTNYINTIPKLNVEEEKAKVTDYHVYGNHLNIAGELEITDKNYKDIKIILYNGKEKTYDITTSIEDTKIIFNTSEYLNEGIYLDNIEKGKYYMFIKVTYENDDDTAKNKEINKYYILNNGTSYKDLTYYTLSKYNKKIIINTDNDYSTIGLTIKENKDDNIYDITIDPGHGGMDSGAVVDKKEEKDYTMAISTKIKNNLEKNGIKVKMTHTENQLTKNDYFDEYNKNGRAVIPNEVKSKYTFSIHINQNNSSKASGIEVYTPDNINYEFAKSLADNLSKNTSFNYSNAKKYKMYNGVYTHTFSQNEISNSLEGYKKKDYKPYNITKTSNYLYIIRETGGYMTGAYVDNSNPEKVGTNPYYNSNIGNESYLLELGYLSNKNDQSILDKEEDKIAEVIANTIIEELSKQ